MSFAVGLACFAVPGMVSVVLFLRITEYRTDIASAQTPFHGKSRISHRNVLRRSNYSEPGQRLFPWFIASIIATQLGGLVAAFFTK